MHRQHPRIYIGGNVYGAGNIGDDAILQGILHLLGRIVPQASIVVGTYDGAALEFLPATVECVKAFDLKEVMLAIRGCDWFICGGGTLIGDELGLAFPVVYTAKLVSAAKLHGKRVSMVSVGANKLQSEEAVRAGRTMVGLCDLITLRDEESRQVCLSLGSDPRHTFTTADPVVLLGAVETARTKELKERLRAGSKVFGVNVVNEAWVQCDGYKRGIAEACDQLAERHGYTPVFFCNEVRPGPFFDFEANRSTVQFLRGKYELLDPVYYSPGEMIDIHAAFDFVLGMRMHSLLFAALAGVPFSAVSRVDKVDNFMRLFDLEPSGSVDRCDAGQIVNDVEALLLRHSSVGEDVAGRVARLRQDYLGNEALLTGLLNERRLMWHKVTFSSARLLPAGSSFLGILTRLLWLGGAMCRAPRRWWRLSLKMRN